jgi:hypothetical protein
LPIAPASALVKGRHNRTGQIMLSVEPVLAHLDRDFDQAVERLRDLLRIKSISTDPAFKGETRQAARPDGGRVDRPHPARRVSNWTRFKTQLT